MSPETRRTLGAELRKLNPHQQASLYRLMKSMNETRSARASSRPEEAEPPSPEPNDAGQPLDVDEIEQRLAALPPEAFELVERVANAELEARK
ncbi:MAG: hypothetical protein AAGG11_21320 [Pseudomonadota bacterium]